MIAHASGARIVFVASRRPPSPTSITREIDARVAKRDERRRGQRLEERELDAGAVEHRGERRVEPHVVDRRAVDSNPLREPAEVRRRVEPGRQAGGARDGLDHRARRALAVRARDVDRAHGVLRIVEPRERLAHALEAELHAARRAPLDLVEARPQRHGRREVGARIDMGNPGRPESWRTIAPMRAFISTAGR